MWFSKNRKLVSIRTAAVFSLLFPALAFAAADKASEFCESSGGVVEVVVDQAGAEMAMCILPDGSEEEVWSYYRAESGANSFTGGGGGDPASLACSRAGGKVQIVKDRRGNEKSLCKLKNGRIFDAWSHYNGNDRDRK